MLLFSLGTYVWSCYLTTRWTSRVCSGDFLDQHEVELESAMLVIWDVEHRFYLVGCGHLLNWYLVLETMFFFCCSCASMTWVFAQKYAFARVTTTVDVSRTEQHQKMLQERLEFKRQMAETDSAIFRLN